MAIVAIFPSSVSRSTIGHAQFYRRRHPDLDLRGYVALYPDERLHGLLAFGQGFDATSQHAFRPKGSGGAAKE